MCLFEYDEVLHGYTFKQRAMRTATDAIHACSELNLLIPCSFIVVVFRACISACVAVGNQSGHNTSQGINVLGDVCTI